MSTDPLRHSHENMWWIYDHVPYSGIFNIRPIGDTNVSVTLISPMTNMNTRKMAQADINYVHIILNMAYNC